LHNKQIVHFQKKRKKNVNQKMKEQPGVGEAPTQQHGHKLDALRPLFGLLSRSAWLRLGNRQPEG